MNRDIKAIVKQMTLEEKSGMCSGKDLRSYLGMHTKEIEGLIQSLQEIADAR